MLGPVMRRRFDPSVAYWKLRKSLDWGINFVVLITSQADGPGLDMYSENEDEQRMHGANGVAA